MRVFDFPVVTWALTTVLFLSGGYLLFQTTTSHQLTDRVNNSLHALMNFLMASMLWDLWAWTMLIQAIVLVGAAHWFLLQTVARPELKMLCAGRHGRLKCAYHSLTMMGAAIMVIIMMGHTSAGGQTLMVGGAAVPHHVMPGTTVAAVTLGPSPDWALLLAGFFGIAAVVFIVLLLRLQLTKVSLTPDVSVLTIRTVRADHVVEALGAGVMTLMFAAMS